MRVKVSIPVSRTEDWERVEIVAFIHDYHEYADGIGESIDYDAECVTILRRDGSVIEDLDIDDLMDIMNDMEFCVLEAMLIEEYLSGNEYDDTEYE